MKRKVYSIADLAAVIPKVQELRYTIVDVEKLEAMLKAIDEWAAANNLKLFQMLSIWSAGTFFVFDKNYEL